MWRTTNQIQFNVRGPVRALRGRRVGHALPLPQSRRVAVAVGEFFGLGCAVARAMAASICRCAALTTIAVLYYRRVTIGAELGGPKASAKRHAALLVGLWFVYVVASILSTEGMI